MRVGGLRVDAISDGAFVARPSYFGDRVPATARPDVFDRDGGASARVVLVDAGLGPALDPMPDGMMLVGGQLPTVLRAAGIHPAEVTDIVITHFHMDHVGWLFGTDAQPTFPN